MNDRRILSRREAAERIGVSERTLDRLSETENGPKKIKLSTRRVGFSASVIDAYLERIEGSAAA